MSPNTLHTYQRLIAAIGFDARVGNHDEYGTYLEIKNGDNVYRVYADCTTEADLNAIYNNLAELAYFQGGAK